APMPREPPVTKATLPAREEGFGMRSTPSGFWWKSISCAGDVPVGGNVVHYFQGKLENHPYGIIGKSGILHPDRRIRRVLGGGTAARPDSGGGQPQRGAARSQSRRAPVPAQHAATHAHGGGRAISRRCQRWTGLRQSRDRIGLR